MVYENERVYTEVRCVIGVRCGSMRAERGKPLWINVFGAVHPNPRRCSARLHRSVATPVPQCALQWARFEPRNRCWKCSSSSSRTTLAGNDRVVLKTPGIPAPLPAHSNYLLFGYP